MAGEGPPRRGARDPGAPAPARNGNGEQGVQRADGGLVLDHTGTQVDFAGGDLSFYGHGFARHREEPPPKDLKREPSIFVTGASLGTHRKWFLRVGGFDDDYFAFFEDVDLGWRTWVLGYECWFIPDAVVYHRHHGTIERRRERDHQLILLLDQVQHGAASRTCSRGGSIPCPAR